MGEENLSAKDKRYLGYTEDGRDPYFFTEFDLAPNIIKLHNLLKDKSEFNRRYDFFSKFADFNKFVELLEKYRGVSPLSSDYSYLLSELNKIFFKIKNDYSNQHPEASLDEVNKYVENYFEEGYRELERMNSKDSISDLQANIAAMNNYTSYKFAHLFEDLPNFKEGSYLNFAYKTPINFDGPLFHVGPLATSKMYNDYRRRQMKDLVSLYGADLVSKYYTPWGEYKGKGGSNMIFSSSIEKGMLNDVLDLNDVKSFFKAIDNIKDENTKLEFLQKAGGLRAVDYYNNRFVPLKNANNRISMYLNNLGNTTINDFYTDNTGMDGIHDYHNDINKKSYIDLYGKAHGSEVYNLKTKFNNLDNLRFKILEDAASKSEELRTPYYGTKDWLFNRAFNDFYTTGDQFSTNYESNLAKAKNDFNYEKQLFLNINPLFRGPVTFLDSKFSGFHPSAFEWEHPINYILPGTKFIGKLGNGILKGIDLSWNYPKYFGKWVQKGFNALAPKIPKSSIVQAGQFIKPSVFKTLGSASAFAGNTINYANHMGIIGSQLYNSVGNIADYFKTPLDKRTNDMKISAILNGLNIPFQLAVGASENIPIIKGLSQINKSKPIIRETTDLEKEFSDFVQDAEVVE